MSTTADQPPGERLISILMPYYGDVGMMRAAVRSCLDQTDGRWRLHVVDDGQVPGVPAWFEALGDPRVTYQRNPRNLGITRNFQKCLDLAPFDNLTMIGCDDVLLPGYVETMLALRARHPDVEMIHPGVEVVDEDGETFLPLVDKVKRRLLNPGANAAAPLSGEDLAVSLLRGNWMYFPSVNWRTDAIRAAGFRPDFTVVQDLDVVIRILMGGGRLVVDDTACFRYRRHRHSGSSAQAADGTRFVEERAYFLETADVLAAHGWHRAARAARWHITSRLHAVTLIPAAARSRESGRVRSLVGHALGSRSASD